MTADVYFMDMGATSRENLPNKLSRLVKSAGIENMLSKDKLTAVKIHFGERGNTNFIRPVYIRQMIQTIRETGAVPFLTDTNTLYKGARCNAVSHIRTAIENGFAFSSMDGAPVVIGRRPYG